MPGQIKIGSNSHNIGFVAMAAVAIVFHTIFTVLAGPSQLTFLSGGSDAPAYSLLASNLLHHRGFTYAGQPTALRPPGYPLFLAAMKWIFGHWWILAIRWLQFLICIATAWLCGRAAKVLFDDLAADAAFVIALLMPTQIFASVQILSECLATFWVALFLFCLVREIRFPAAKNEVGMGVSAGIAAMIRFNSAALPLIGALAIFRYPGRRRRIAFAGILVIPLILVTPWLIRNIIVFHREVLFSTQGGVNAVQGVLTPEGRTQFGDTQRLRQAVGWVLSDVETNEPSRLALPSEAVLNKECWNVVPGLWETWGWGAVPLLGKKLSDFWLSTDQVFDTGGLSRSSRLIRLAGVGMYWVALVLAIVGWILLRQSWPAAAKMLLAYALIYTVLHLPLVMSTRIRFPLMDPLVASLAGGVFSTVFRDRFSRSANFHPSAASKA